MPHNIILRYCDVIEDSEQEVLERNGMKGTRALKTCYQMIINRHKEQKLKILSGKYMKRDLTGERFGKLTVIGQEKKEGSNKIYWRCKCDCGRETVVEHYHLTEGRTKSCGCLRPGGRGEDLTGMRFGRLTVIGPEPRKKGEGRSWKCRCDCGRICVCSGAHLKKGATRSCGCLREDHQREAIRTSIHIVDGTCIEKISSKAMFSNNTTGTRGVYRNGAGKWKASIGFQGKIYNLGTYADYDDAVAARKEAEENLYVPFLEKYQKESIEDLQNRMSASD